MEWILLIVILIVGGFGILLVVEYIVYGIVGIVKKGKKKRQEEQKAEEQKAAQEAAEAAYAEKLLEEQVQFYKDCCKRNLSNIDDIRLLAQKYSTEISENPEQSYDTGKNEAEKQEIDQQKEKRSRYFKIANEQYTISQKDARDKYEVLISEFRKKLADIDRRIASAKDRNALSTVMLKTDIHLENPNGRYKGLDSDGRALADIANYVNDEKNRQYKQERDMRISENYQTRRETAQEIHKLTKERGMLISKLNQVEKIIIDNNQQLSDLFKNIYVDTKSVQLSLVYDKLPVITLETHCNEMSMLGAAASIDGTLIVEVYYKKLFIGSGYYNGKGVSDGFNCKDEVYLTEICDKYDTIPEKDSKEFKIVVKPFKLWLVEKIKL